MKNVLVRFLKDESGATAIEYGLIAALIAIAATAGMTALGDGLQGMFSDIGGSLDGAQIVQ